MEKRQVVNQSGAFKPKVLVMMLALNEFKASAESIYGAHKMLSRPWFKLNPKVTFEPPEYDEKK